MLAELSMLVFGAFVLDFVLGDPPNRFHPVCLVGWWAGVMEKFFRKLGSGSIAGMFAAYFVFLPFILAVALLVYFGEFLLVSYGGIVVGSVLLYFCFAPAGLALHARRVYCELANGGIEEARRRLSMMVGRNTSELDENGISRASVESVAENFTDGVASPIFFAVLGYVVAGVFGAAIFTVFYRISNTLDSMWGKLDERYRHFGTFAARLDDVLNYIPARIAIFAVAVSSVPLGLDFKNAIRIGLRDCRRHESPNSAWTEAAFSGALGIRLGGPAVYAGRTVHHPFIGEELGEATPRHIQKAIRLMIFSSLVFAAACIAAGAAGSQYFLKTYLEGTL